MEKIISYFLSSKIMLYLMIIVAVAMAFGTFIENAYGRISAYAVIYDQWWFEFIFIFLFLNFLGNIGKYRLIQNKKWSALILHLSIIFILLGAGFTRYISYEGTMHLLEGSTSNQIASTECFLSVILDDNKEQLHAIDKKIIFSNLEVPLLYKNKFSKVAVFRDKKAKIEFVTHIPNAEEELNEAEDGIPIYHLVLAGENGRKNKFIAEGDNIIVAGEQISFGDEKPGAINITRKNGKFYINPYKEGTNFIMLENKRNLVIPDSLQELNIATLYTFGGVNFVIKRFLEKGKVSFSSSEAPNKSSKNLLVFDVTVDGVTKKAELLYNTTQVSSYLPLSFNGLNVNIRYSPKYYEIPFSIKLNDFQLDKYPGSDMAASYASEVTVIDGDSNFDFRIFMNNILKYKGFRFFQSSYNITPSGKEYSFLSVNHDFWGTNITYLGYYLLYLGMIFLFFDKNSRFTNLSKRLTKLKEKVGKSKITMALFLLFFSSSTYAQDSIVFPSASDYLNYVVDYKIDKVHSDKFGKILVQDVNGRIKPANTFAIEVLRKIYKKDHFRDLDANQVLLGMMTDPRSWGNIPMIYLGRVNKNKFKNLLGIDVSREYATLLDFYNEKGDLKIYDEVKNATKQLVKGKFDQEIIQLHERFMVMSSVLGSGNIRFFPIPNDSNNTWVSFREPKEQFSGDDSLFVSSIYGLYFRTLENGKSNNDYSNADMLLDGIYGFQKKYASGIIPTKEKIEFEIAYNRYDVFKKLFVYYMYAGVLLFLFLFLQIFNESKFNGGAISLFSFIIVFLFFVHTAGLGVRWYISGHAPWSDAFESMIYVAWATMFFGIVLAKKSTFTLATTSFLTAMILMIAHWNWMDPAISNLQPVLNSYWLMIHVAMIVASYGPFALSMILGVVVFFLYIFRTKNNYKKLTDTIIELTIINEMSITIGLVMLTIGNFLGGMWANESWGRYWGWDPKETWALISIFIYAIVIHVRFVPGLKSKFIFNFLTIVSFASIIMTYLGVNFYLSGKHSYGSGAMTPTPTFIYYGVTFVSILTALAYYRVRTVSKNKRKG